MSRLPKLLGRLSPRWRWTLHNMVAHPLSEIVYQIGLKSVSNWVHDVTIPDPQGEEPRG